MIFFARNASEYFCCVRVHKRRFIRKLQSDRAYEMPCPAAANLDGKRKTGLAIALVAFICILLYQQFLLLCSQELNHEMKNFFPRQKNLLKQLKRLKLHLSRHDAHKYFVAAIKNCTYRNHHARAYRVY